MLKLVHSRQSPESHPDSRPPTERVTSAGKRRILLVEDDFELRRLLGLLLSLDGYDVFEMGSGDEFLAWVDELSSVNERQVDLVITDVRMPGFSGLDVLEYMRLVGDQTPVILMSAFADDDVEADAQRLGAELTLSKPFVVDDMLAAVHAVA